jgi:sulfur carrier protein ThiS
MVQNEPQKVCDEYWIDIDDIYSVEEELIERINALEDKDIKWFCESKLKQVNYSNSRIEWIKSEIERLQKLQETEEKHLEKAKKSIDWIMKATWTEKLETALNNLSYRKSESVSILDENSIPEEYWKVKEVRSIDKIMIKEAIKSWKDVIGASIETKQNLQIK